MKPCQRTPKFSKTSKKSKFHLKLRELKAEAKKKNMSNPLKTIFIVHWASFDCKVGLSLTEPRYKK